MSGSSHASQALSRCVVAIDAGINISWAPSPDGNDDHGASYHREEEARFLSRIAAATPAIEVLFDELEQAGRRFSPPGSTEFHTRSVTASHHFEVESYELSVACEPAMDEPELKALAERVARLLADAKATPDRPPVERPTPPVLVLAEKPWWKFW